MGSADRLREVLKAADARLGAREDQMVMSVEWDEFARSVHAFKPQAAPSAQREETFAVEDGFFVRSAAYLRSSTDCESSRWKDQRATTARSARERLASPAAARP